LSGRCRFRRDQCRLLFRFPDEHPRPLHCALVLPLGDDLVERGAILYRLHRLDRGVLEVAVQGDRENLRLIAPSHQRLQRRAPHRFEHRVPRNRPEQPSLVDPGQGAERDRLASRRFGDLDERPRIGDHVDRLEAGNLARIFERFQRDLPQHGSRLRPN
jgi:hypothetical protein